MNQYLEVVSGLLVDAAPHEGAISSHTNAIQFLVRVEQRIVKERLDEIGEVVELIITSVIARALLLKYAHPRL